MTYPAENLTDAALARTQLPDISLSIVIVSWNTRAILDDCLGSIFANPPGDQFEVLVVDNASTDGTVELIRSRYPQVRLFCSEKNLGFAGGNNLAIPECAGRYVLLLNPDTKILPGALDRLTHFLEETPQAGAAGARLLNADGSLQLSCYPRPELFREFWRLFHLDLLYPYASYPVEKWPLDRPRRVDVLMGACLLLKREVLEQAGSLDETFFIYSEEVDLCLRIQRAGWQLFWVPQAQVVHYGGQSTQQVAAEMFLRLYQGKILYFRKHYGFPAAQIYKLILATATLGRLLFTPLAFLEPSVQRRRHLALSRQYSRLLFALPAL